MPHTHPQSPPTPPTAAPPALPPHPPPPGPAGPPLFLVEISDSPLFSHPLWTELDNVIPAVRVETRFKYDASGKNTWSPAAGPADTVYGFMTTLTRLMNGFGPHYRGRPFRWYGIPALFGATRNEKELTQYPNAIPLLDNPADHLKSGRRGPFFAEGLRRNRDWSQEFFDHLASELKYRRFPDPLAFILTSEHGPGDDYWGHHGDPDDGWVPEALADPRATDPTQTIDGTHTFAQYMAAGRTLEGGPIPAFKPKLPMSLPAGRGPANDENSEQYRGAMRLAWDWSREQAFASIARAAFRRDAAQPKNTVRIGEYESYCESRWAPVRIRPNTLTHQMNGIFHSDLQCPDWYGGLPFLRTDPAFEAADPGWETLNNWLRVYPNQERDPVMQRRRVALEVAKHIAEAAADSAPNCPLAPYVYNTPEAPEDDMVEYLRHCRQHGAWAVNIFMPKIEQASHDYWHRVIPRVCA